MGSAAIHLTGMRMGWSRSSPRLLVNDAVPTSAGALDCRPMDTHVDADVVARDVAEMRERGFVIIEGLLATDDLARMRAALKPQLERELFGRNNFEGHRTERVYSLVAVAPIFADLVEHPRILAICDAFLEPNYLLTASQAIEIHP